MKSRGNDNYVLGLVNDSMKKCLSHTQAPFLEQRRPQHISVLSHARFKAQIITVLLPTHSLIKETFIEFLPYRIHTIWIILLAYDWVVNKQDFCFLYSVIMWYPKEQSWRQLFPMVITCEKRQIWWMDFKVLVELKSSLNLVNIRENDRRETGRKAWARRHRSF